MTFKDLQKLVQAQSGPEQSQLSQRLRDKPFWIWDQQQHRQKDIKTKGDCCFNHIIGLPKKENKREVGEILSVPTALELLSSIPFNFGQDCYSVANNISNGNRYREGGVGARLPG
ncbi:MAG TPA: hypothetical protein VJ799_13485 [Nitrososphaeraceae archaeon]|nr:hypothetical protein [Nitrososphaeraceae archaeon]